MKAIAPTFLDSRNSPGTDSAGLANEWNEEHARMGEPSLTPNFWPKQLYRCGVCPETERWTGWVGIPRLKCL